MNTTVLKKGCTPRRGAALAAVSCLGLLLVLLWLLGVYPFGGGTLLTGDLKGQYIHYYAHFRAALREGGGLGFAMEKSLGGNVMGLLTYYCASPLGLLFLLLPVADYDIAVTLAFVLKLTAAAAAMAYFLLRRLPSLGGRVVPLAVSYALCGYCMAYAQNIMWLDVVALMPLILCGIWQIIEGRGPALYTLCLGGAVFTEFYIAYMACIFSVLYFLFEMTVALPAENRLPFVRKRLLRFAGGSLLGGGLAGVLLVPSLGGILAGKGTGGGFAAAFTTEFSLGEFWRRLAPGCFEWRTDILVTEQGPLALPNVYSGVFVLVCAVLFFFCRGISAREKAAGGAVLLVLFLSLYSTDLMLAWHGFSAPVWFYWRNSFLFTLWLVFLAAFALAKGQWTRIGAAGGGAVLAVWLLLCLPRAPGMYTRNRWLLTVLLCGAFFAALLLLWRFGGKKRVRTGLYAAVFAATAAELVLSGYWGLSQFEFGTTAAYKSFVRDGSAAIAAVRQQDDDAYRMEKTYFYSLNDAMSLGYYGLEHFSSLQDDACTDLLHALGYSSTGIYGEGNSLFADSFLGIRYLLAKPGDEVPAGYEATGVTAGEVAVYRNECALPLMFAVTEELRQVTPAGQEPDVLQNRLWKAISGQDGMDTAALAQFAQKARAAVSGSTLTRTSFTATIRLEEENLVLITIPWYDSLVADIDGETTAPERLPTGLCALRLPAGTHTVRLYAKTAGIVPGALLSAASLCLLLVWQIAPKTAGRSRRKSKKSSSEE